MPYYRGQSMFVSLCLLLENTPRNSDKYQRPSHIERSVMGENEKFLQGHAKLLLRLLLTLEHARRVLCTNLYAPCVAALVDYISQSAVDKVLFCHGLIETRLATLRQQINGHFTIEHVAPLDAFQSCPLERRWLASQKTRPLPAWRPAYPLGALSGTTSGWRTVVGLHVNDKKGASRSLTRPSISRKQNGRQPCASPDNAWISTLQGRSSSARRWRQ